MAKPMNIHIHEANPVTTPSSRGEMTEAICTRFKPSGQVVSLAAYSAWRDQGYTTAHFCSDCVRGIE